MRSRFRLGWPALFVAVVAAGAGALAACGSSGSSSPGSTSTSASASGSGVASESASQIVAASKTASMGASSVIVSGVVNTRGSNLQLDLRLLAGGGGDGKISVNGQSVQVRLIGQDLYVQASRQYLQQQGVGAGQAALVADRWLKVPLSNQNFAQLANVLSSKSLLGQLFSATGTLSKGQISMIGGQQVISVSDSTGSLFIATSGPPYVVRATGSGQSSGHLDFSSYGVPLNLQAPPNAIDLTH